MKKLWFRARVALGWVLLAIMAWAPVADALRQAIDFDSVRFKRHVKSNWREYVDCWKGAAKAFKRGEFDGGTKLERSNDS